MGEVRENREYTSSARIISECLIHKSPIAWSSVCLNDFPVGLCLLGGSQHQDGFFFASGHDGNVRVIENLKQVIGQLM